MQVTDRLHSTVFSREQAGRSKQEIVLNFRLILTLQNSSTTQASLAPARMLNVSTRYLKCLFPFRHPYRVCVCVQICVRCLFAGDSGSRILFKRRVPSFALHTYLPWSKQCGRARTHSVQYPLDVYLLAECHPPASPRGIAHPPPCSTL